MTQSDNIKEFLKYASPRLDYIFNCMEKQALSPSTAAGALKQIVRTGRKVDDLSPLSNVFRKANITPDEIKSLQKAYANDLRLAQETAARTGKELVLPEVKLKDGWVSGIEDAMTARNSNFYNNVNFYKPLQTAGREYAAHMGTLADDVDDATRAAHSAKFIDKFKADFSNDPKVKELLTKHNITADELLGRVANTHLRSGAVDAAADRKNARALQWLFKDMTGKKAQEAGKLINRLGDWFKEHPVATPAIAAGSAAAAAGGLGYSTGSSSGYDEAMENAHAYYSLRERFREEALRAANSSVLSRLANVFGAGELNTLLSGNV